MYLAALMGLLESTPKTRCFPKSIARKGQEGLCKEGVCIPNEASRAGKGPTAGFGGVVVVAGSLCFLFTGPVGRYVNTQMYIL